MKPIRTEPPVSSLSVQRHELNPTATPKVVIGEFIPTSCRGSATPVWQSAAAMAADHHAPIQPQRSRHVEKAPNLPARVGRQQRRGCPRIATRTATPTWKKRAGQAPFRFSPRVIARNDRGSVRERRRSPTIIQITLFTPNMPIGGTAAPPQDMKGDRRAPLWHNLSWDRPSLSGPDDTPSATAP